MQTPISYSVNAIFVLHWVDKITKDNQLSLSVQLLMILCQNIFTFSPMYTKLVFRWNDPLQSFVFADLDQAIRTDQMHRALFHCKTWSELKSAVHPDEYGFLVYMHYDFDDKKAEIEPDGEINWDFFSKDSYRNGSNPAFLIYSMNEIIPADILEEFGTYEIFTEVFSYRRITADKLVPMITSLTARGYDVAPAGDLIFDDFYNGSQP